MNGHAKSKKKQSNIAVFETVMDEFYHTHILKLLFQIESSNPINGSNNHLEKKKNRTIKNINKLKNR